MSQAPIFQRIKDYIIAQIESGAWAEGTLIPTEMALTKTFSTSRMTVNRALRELTAELVLVRRQGAGTYVAPQKVQSTLVEIKNIADEIAARGHRHHAQLHALERIPACEMLAQQFKLKVGQHLFHSIMVHFENAVPIQVEERWVNPSIAPDYMTQDFNHVTPNEYLMNVAPLQGMDYRLEAVLPTQNIASMLHIEPSQPCLVLHRTTRSANQIATCVTMWHAGNRYQFVGGKEQSAQSS
ncbi:histidine utilization repressor [Hydromonas duriensis]|uniref:Histidine utilization repressor n=1 Tax=Hydromonas duriensis TaxID=1527608 RepID=A0A4R6Y0P6_9BURK|nr:histidine utilization repressor [Hydromonas duriensis]TDR28875.1 GntR family histidine utilization transcriptional repressor [Hydromonas duriensis]